MFSYVLHLYIAILINCNPVIVYDGGILIQNLSTFWTRRKTMGGIVNEYVSYLTKQTRDSQEIIVVFDWLKKRHQKDTFSVRGTPLEPLIS